MPSSTKPRNIPCHFPGCGRFFTSQGGLNRHYLIHNREQRVRQGHQSAVQHIQDLDNPIANADLDDGTMDNGAQNIEDESSKPPTERIERHPIINGVFCYSLLDLYFF